MSVVNWICVASASVVLLQAGAGFADDAERQRVQNDVKAIVHAVYAGDIDTVLRYTHPTIIELQGGPEAAREILSQAVSGFKKLGMRLESLSFPRTPEFIETAERRFAVVPTVSIIAGHGGRAESLNFQLGVLEKDSTRWHYVEGSRLDKGNIQILFPGFPTDYEFPPFYRKRL